MMERIGEGDYREMVHRLKTRGPQYLITRERPYVVDLDGRVLDDGGDTRVRLLYTDLPSDPTE